MMRLTHFDPLHKNEPSSLQSTLFDKKEYLHTRDKIRKNSAATSLTTPAVTHERNTRENLSIELDDIPESCIPLYCNDEQRQVFKSLCQYADQPNMTVKDILVPLSHPLLMEQKYRSSDLTAGYQSQITKMGFLYRFLTRIASISRKTFKVNILCNGDSLEYLLYEFVSSLRFDCKKFRDFYKESENTYGIVLLSKGLIKANSRSDVNLLLVYDSAVPPDLNTENIFKQPSSSLFTIYLTLVNTPEIRLFNYINLHPDEDISWTTPIHELSPSARQCLLTDIDYTENEEDKEWNDYIAIKLYRWSMLDRKKIFRETRIRPLSLISKPQYPVHLKRRHWRRGRSDTTAKPEIADILSKISYNFYGHRGYVHHHFNSHHSSSNISISGSSDGIRDGSIGSNDSRRGPRSVSPIPKAPRSMTYNDRATTYSKHLDNNNNHYSYDDNNNYNNSGGSGRNNRHYRISSTDMDEDSHLNRNHYSSNRGPRASTSLSPSNSSTTSSYDEPHHVENYLNRRNHHSSNKRTISSEMGENVKRMKHSTREGSKSSPLTAEPSDNKSSSSSSPLKRKKPITLSLSKKYNNSGHIDHPLKSPEIEQTRQPTPSSSPIAKHQRLVSPSRNQEEEEEQSGRRSSPIINRVPGPSTSTNRDPILSVSPVRELEKPPISPLATTSSSLLSPTVNKKLPIYVSQPPSLPISSSSSIDPTISNNTDPTTTVTPPPPPPPPTSSTDIKSQKEPMVPTTPQLDNTISKKAISESTQTLSRAEPTGHETTTTDQQQQVKNVQEEDSMTIDNAMSEFEKALEKIHMQFQAALQE